MTVTLERITPFRNEEIRPFTDPADIASLEAALIRARARFGSAIRS